MRKEEMGIGQRSLQPKCAAPGGEGCSASAASESSGTDASYALSGESSCGISFVSDRESGASLLGLFWAFLKVGLFTIGGAYAMLPVAEKMLKDLYDPSEITEAFTVAQTLPGVIAANTSAVLGNQKRGFPGAVFSVLGVITPSVIIISLIAAVFARIQDMELMNRAFSGIRIGVLALLVKSAYELWKKTIKGFWTFGIFGLSLAAVSLKLLPAPYVVLIAAGLGLIFGSVRRGGRAC